MLDVLKTLSGTPAPSILMGLGGILILLAFVQKIGTHIELPASRQRLAAIVGGLFLFAGIFVSVAPTIEMSGGSTSKTTKKALSDSIAPSVNGSTSTASAPSRSTPLSNLIPRPEVIPDNLSFDSADKWGVDGQLERTGFDADGAAVILTGSTFEGVSHRYSAFCGRASEMIVTATFQVGRFESPDHASRYWALDYDDPKAVGLSKTGDTFEMSIPGKCGGPVVTYWKGRLVGDLHLWVGLRGRPGVAASAKTRRLADKLLASMVTP